jgi:serine/threonine protein kinase
MISLTPAGVFENKVFVDKVISLSICHLTQDLKTHLRDPRVVIADLDDGVSISNDQPVRYVCGTRRYRAPEVYSGEKDGCYFRIVDTEASLRHNLLGNAWDMQVDMFSAGCVAYELQTGLPLLPDTTDIIFLFKNMENVIGKFDEMTRHKFRDRSPNLFMDDAPLVGQQSDSVRGCEERLASLRPFRVCARFGFRLFHW